MAERWSYRFATTAPLRYIVALFLTTLQTACGGERPHGVLVVATPGEPATLFPPHIRSAQEIAIASQIFLKLVDIGPGLNTVGDSGFVPELAESWTFRDSTTIAFRLDPAARWQDGTPVSARDVGFTFAVYRDTLVAAPAAPLLSRIRSVDAEDEHTVVVRFTVPYPAQFYDAVYHMRILPAHLLDTIPRAALRAHPALARPVGSGPYRVARWLPGELVELEAVPDWWGHAVGAERVIFRVTADLQTAIGQLVAGEAQIVEALPTAEDVARVNGSQVARAVEFPSAVYIYLGFNLAMPPLQDRRLRQALTLTVDRAALVDVVLGGRGVVPAGPVTPAVWISAGAQGQPPADPAGARDRLEALGWVDRDGDGIREQDGRRLAFDILYPAQSGIRERTAVILEQQFRAVGVAVRLVPLEFNTFIERQTQGRFDAVLGGWQVDLLPDAMRELWGSEGIGGSNYGRYASATFDSLVRAASTSRDVATARDTWHRALAEINADAPAVWLFSPQLAAGVAQGVEGVTLRPDNWAATLRGWRVVR